MDAIGGVRVLRPHHLAGAGSGLHQLDETKLLIGTGGLAPMRARSSPGSTRVHGVQPELAGTGHVLCITTIGNTDTDMDRLVAGFTEVAEHFGRKDVNAPGALTADLLAVRPQPVLTPREAFFAADETIPLCTGGGTRRRRGHHSLPAGHPTGDARRAIQCGASSRCCSRLREAGNPISASDPSMESVKAVR